MAMQDEMASMLRSLEGPLNLRLSFTTVRAVPTSIVPFFVVCLLVQRHDLSTLYKGGRGGGADWGGVGWGGWFGVCVEVGAVRSGVVCGSFGWAVNTSGGYLVTCPALRLLWLWLCRQGCHGEVSCLLFAVAV